MKDKIINLIRSVPIADKTYAEYVEALADEMMSFCVEQASFDQMTIYILEHYAKQKAREIFEDIEPLLYLHEHEHRPFASSNYIKYYGYSLKEGIAELKKKYGGGE